MIALWAPIIGYEGLYQVCSTGSVFSHPRRKSHGGLLRPGTSEGYPMVVLWKNGHRKSFKIHRLVLEAFDGPCPAGQECRHLDGNRLNNAWPENLEWGTPGQNNLDRTRHGTNPSSRVVDDQVLSAFGMWESGSSVAELAASLMVTANALRQRMRQLDAKRYERLAVGNQKLSDAAVLVYYQRWHAGETKSALAREAGVDHKALHYRFNRMMSGQDPFAEIDPHISQERA